MAQALVKIIQDMVLDGPKPAKVVASEINKPYATLLREINPHDLGAKVGVETMLELMQVTGMADPLAYMAKDMGYVLVPARKGEAVEGEAMSLCLKLMEEVGQLARSVHKGLEAGSLSLDEYDRIERMGYAASSVVLGLLESLSGICAEKQKQRGDIAAA